MAHFADCYRRTFQLILVYWLAIAWIAINCGIFWIHYRRYKNGPQYYYLRRILGHGLLFSRASAAVLNLSCCVILLPMCRFFNLMIHHILDYISPSALTLWLKRNKNIHVICAMTVIAASVVHTIAHVINTINFSQYYDAEHPELNWAQYAGQPPTEMIFTSVVGITGVSMILLLVIISVTSQQWIRLHHYQIFWTTHHLHLPFLLLLLAHPLSGTLKELANPEQHIPGCQNEKNGSLFLYGNVEPQKIRFKDNLPCTNEAVFLPVKSESLIWILPPLLLCIFDRAFWSWRRNWRTLYVQQVERLPGSALKLTLQSTSQIFHCVPGQYILLQCPAVSSIEWHPFSIISYCAMKHSNLSVLVHAKGDWTGELLGKVLVSFRHKHLKTELVNWPSSKAMKFLVDGPFRSPMERIVNCSVAVCIAGGVGITPFIAVLTYLLVSCPRALPRRLHLVWIVREVEQLLWCAQLLCDVHDKLWNANQPDKLELRIHITKRYNAADIQKVLCEDHQLLRQRIWKGRPQWTELFNQWTEIYEGNFHTYVSGPYSLASETKKCCLNLNKRGAAIHFVQEAFS